MGNKHLKVYPYACYIYDSKRTSYGLYTLDENERIGEKGFSCHTGAAGHVAFNLDDEDSLEDLIDNFFKGISGYEYLIPDIDFVFDPPFLSDHAVLTLTRPDKDGRCVSYLYRERPLTKTERPTFFKLFNKYLL